MALETINVPLTGGKSLTLRAALPAGGAKAPAVLVLHEWWGLTAQIEGTAERFAKEGFVAAAVDLYHGKRTTNPDEAAKLMKALDFAKAVAEIGAAADVLRKHARGNGKVGLTGFCMGGALTLAAVQKVKLDAAVMFYGLPGAPFDAYTKVTAPIQAHVATNDAWVTPAAAEKVAAAVRKAGGSFELHTYDAQHAFMNENRPEVYSAENAGHAWHRAVTFFHQHLG